MSKPPLVVQFLFHPRSTRAHALAERLHGALNDDPVVRGLQVPTTFSPSTAELGPPLDRPGREATHDVVVVLADDELNADPAWCAFVGDVAEALDPAVDGFVPIQLDEAAWPLDPRLDGRSFVRALGTDPHGSTTDEAAAEATRRVVIELCRILDPTNVTGEDRAPTTVFVSHTKVDLDDEPGVVEAIVGALRASQPVNGWFDSGDIAAGSRFAEKIESGLRDSSLLCILTDNYASREWCRLEVLLAKREQRPALVVDAIRSQQVRSFPYIGNVPVLRWSGDDPGAEAQIIVDRLVKETLRVLHARLLLGAAARPGDRLLVRPPELVTLRAGQDDENGELLYPDPPLGDEETALLEANGATATTPLVRISTAFDDLAGRRLGLSLSNSTDIGLYGFGPPHLRSAVLELSRYLLIRGATLVYAGHLAEDGHSVALFELVKAHNRLAGVAPVARVENHVGWPVPITTAHRSHYRYEATLIAIPRPEGIDESLDPDFVEEIGDRGYFPADRSARHRLAWSLGMADLRAEQAAADLDARIVAGGVFGPTPGPRPDGSTAEGWYQGRIPGVLEEILLAARRGTPVFLLGAFGGVARLVLDTIEGIDRPELTWDYHRRAPHAEDLEALYRERGLEWQGYDEIVAELRDLGLRGLNPLLSDDEHRQLGRVRHVPQMLELLLAGLDRLD